MTELSEDVIQDLTRRHARPHRIVLALLLLAGLTHLFLEWLERTPYGSSGWILFSELLCYGLAMVASLVLMAPLWIVISGAVRIRSGRWLLSRRDLLLWLAYACLSALMIWAGFRIARRGTSKVCANARELIVAIEQYCADTGQPPLELTDLVPRYLASLPATGVGRSPEFGYVQGAEAEEGTGKPWLLHIEVGHLGYFIAYFAERPFPGMIRAKRLGGRLYLEDDWGYYSAD